MPQWLDSWNAGIANFLSPSATYAGSGMTEDQIKAAQRTARLQMAAGLLSGVGSGGASPLAKGLGAGLQGVAGVNENAMQNAYRNTMQKKQMEREDRLLQAQEAEIKQKRREQAALTAANVSQGMTSASDPAAYWALIQNMPEVQGMLTEYNIDPSAPQYAADPAAMSRALGTYGQVGTPQQPTDDQREYELARAQGYSGSFYEYMRGMRQAGAVNVNLGAQGLSTPPTGFFRPDPLKPGLIVEPGGPIEQQEKKENESTKVAAGYLSRMDNAEQLLGSYAPNTQDYIAANALYGGAGSAVASAANNMMTQEGQLFYQAAADWVRAKLRKESGAVIGPEEMQSEIRTYFPVPGDSQQVIAQKARARQTAIEAMRKSAGPSAQAEPTASDAKGNKFVVRNGKWVPMKQAQ